MAKRSYTRNTNKMTKIQPAVQTIALTMSVPAGATTSAYADLSQIASIVNRRFYRQGINWAVAGMKVFNVNGVSGGITCFKLPNTWVMSNAWEKGMRAWSKMNREALSETPSVRPKFLDFKIYADFAHAQAGIENNLLPVNTTVAASRGEWEASKFVIPNSANPGFSTEREVIAVGANYQGNGLSGLNSVSLIEGYAASRGLPDILDPNAPDDAAEVDGATPANFLQALFNEGTNQDEQVIEDMISENNTAPYPFENGPDQLNPLTPFGDTMYPNGANQLAGLQIHDIEYFTPTTISNTVRLKGGSFPCGLIRFDGRNSGIETATISILIDLVPGMHRGYMCQPMTEM